MENTFSLDYQSPYKILVATTCVGQYEKFMAGWLTAFRQLQTNHYILKEFVARPPLQESGELTNNKGRLLSIQQAIQWNMDWLFFVDVDIRLDADTVIKLLKHNYPFVAGGVSARDDPNYCIGHIYLDRDIRLKEKLTKEFLSQPRVVDGVGGGFMMVHKDIFRQLDLTQYLGSQAYPYGYMGADEFFDNQVFEWTGIKPLIDPNINCWHLFGNQKSRLWGQQEFCY